MRRVLMQNDEHVTRLEYLGNAVVLEYYHRIGDERKQKIKPHYFSTEKVALDFILTTVVKLQGEGYGFVLD